MYTLILGILAGIIAANIIFRKTIIYDFMDVILVSCPGAIVGMMLSLVVGLAIPMKTEEVKTTYYIENLQDNFGPKGSFFLGTGVIDGKMKYVFYYKTKNDNSFKLNQIDYDNVTINYSEDKPRAEKFELLPQKDVFLNNFSLRGPCSCDIRWEIYVPKGSIRQDFSLDAK